MSKKRLSIPEQMSKTSLHSHKNTVPPKSLLNAVHDPKMRDWIEECFRCWEWIMTLPFLRGIRLRSNIHSQVPDLNRKDSKTSRCWSFNEIAFWTSRANWATLAWSVSFVPLIRFKSEKISFEGYKIILSDQYSLINSETLNEIFTRTSFLLALLNSLRMTCFSSCEWDGFKKIAWSQVVKEPGMVGNTAFLARLL